MAFKMRSGNSPLEFKQVGSSPVKQTYDASGTDERVYDIDQNKYDEWRKGTNAPDIRYLGSRENKAWLEKYLASKTTPPVETPTEEPETEEPQA